MAGLFGKKTTREEAVQKKGVLTTGGKIDDIVMALIAAAPDSEAPVRDTISTALLDIGRRRAELVLSSIVDFLTKNPKTAEEHRVILLKVTNQVLELKRDEIVEDLALDLVGLALSEMTREKDVMAEWQGAASATLVSLGMRFPKLIMEELMKRFSPGTVPHYFVMKTLGDFAIANPMATVPMLKDGFARMLPVLASIKQDNMKWVFAATLGFFCEAVVSYLANSGGQEGALTASHFSSEVFPAYEFIFNNWLGSGKEEVRLASVQSIGFMCAIMEKNTLEAQLPKLVPALLSSLRKEKKHLPVASGLYLVLEASVRGGSRALELQLPPLLQTLHPMACAYQSPDANVPQSFKTSNELLRCFEVIGRVFADPLLMFLVKVLESKDASARSGTLRIIKHLVNTLDSVLTEEKKKLLLTGVQPLVQQESWRRVKKILAEVVIAMASKDYLLLEGGQQLVEFIVRNSAISDQEVQEYEMKARQKPPEDNVSPAELRSMCDNILHLLTTTIPRAHRVLWPYLLETIPKPSLTAAVSVICKSIAVVATQKRAANADDYKIQFDKQVNVPKPQAIITRLLVLLNYPFRRPGLGVNILEALRAIGPVLHASVAEMWDTALPKLVAFLERKNSEWTQTSWEDLVLRLMAETIKHAADDEWTCGLAEHIADQFVLYTGEAELKRCAYRHTGLILQKIQHKDLIRTRLDSLFNTAVHTSEPERLGVAQAFGFAAASHLDAVIERLQALTRVASEAKESGGLLSLFGGAKKTPEGPAINCIVLCFGFVAAYAPPALLVSRMEVHILNHIKPFIVDTKSVAVKDVGIRTLALIGKAMHPSHLKKRHALTQRDDLVRAVLGFLTPYPSESVTNPIVAAGLSTLATLVALDPLPKDLEAMVLEKTLPLFKIAVNAPEVAAILAALNEVLATMLLMEPTAVCLTRLLRALEPWASHAEALCRERSCESALFLLKKFVEYLGREKDPSTSTPPSSPANDRAAAERKFTEAGKHVAMLAPRCADPVPAVRRLAVECVQMTLYVAVVLRRNAAVAAGAALDLKPPEELRPLSAFKERAVAAELNDQFAIIHDTSAIVGALLATEDIHELLLAAVRGLNDVEVNAASGTCVMLNTLIKARGSELAPKVKDIVQGFLNSMPSIKNEQTMNGALHSLRSLAVHHLALVLDELLESPTPHSAHVVKAFQVIAKDDNLVLREVNHFTHILNNTQVLEEKMSPKDRSKTVAEHNPRAISATAALGEIMQTEELEALVKEHYYLFAATLLLRFGTANSSPTAAEQAATSFKHFVACSKDEVLTATMEQNDNWKRVVSEKYAASISEIAAAIGRSHVGDIANIFQFMLPYLKGTFVGQRVVTAATFAAFIEHSKNDRLLLQQLVNCLLASLSDPNIKALATVGLGNIGSVGITEANKYAPTILDALMSGIDDTNDAIAMEAMRGLAKVFDFVDEQRIAPTLVNICLRIRPAFEKSYEPIRGASYALFGSLHRFGGGSAAHMFNDQIHNNLPALVLHVNDESPSVQVACKRALRQLGPLIGSDEVNQYFQSKALEETRVLAYDEFVNDLSKLLIAAFPERVNYYVMTCVEAYKSSWNVIKANAALFSGNLLGNISAEQRKTINLSPGIAANALVQLLKEKHPDVRRKAAIAMSLLTQY